MNNRKHHEKMQAIVIVADQTIQDGSEILL